jgi:hypothetical protein
VTAHQELGRLEGRPPMRRDGDDEHDLLAGRDAAMAMHDGYALERPALLRLLDDARDLLLGHARIMLDLERREASAFIAANSGEGHDGADIASPARERRDLGTDVESLRLDADDHGLRLSGSGGLAQELLGIRHRQGADMLGDDPPFGINGESLRDPVDAEIETGAS